jgi:hypothetical protein
MFYFFILCIEPFIFESYKFTFFQIIINVIFDIFNDDVLLA